jgi:hypothetical protein
MEVHKFGIRAGVIQLDQLGRGGRGLQSSEKTLQGLIGVLTGLTCDRLHERKSDGVWPPDIVDIFEGASEIQRVITGSDVGYLVDPGYRYHRGISSKTGCLTGKRVAVPD